MKKNEHEFEKTLTDKWQEALDKSFKKKIKNTKVDGFRKGTCPKNIYIKKFGIESLYMDAIDLVINDAYKMILDENKDIVPVIEPKVDIVSVNADEVKIKFTVITKPEIKLGAYKNLGIKKEKATVTAEQVAEKIRSMQNEMADLAVKEDKTVANGDTAIIDFDGYVDEKPLDGGKGENYSLEIGSKTFIPGFEEGLIGHKVGDKVTLNLTFPKDYTENLKGKKVRFEVTINEVKTRVVPEIDEDFFKDLGYEDVKTEADLKKKVKADLQKEKEKSIDDKYTEECLNKACDNMKADINDEIIDDEVHHMIHEFEHRLAHQGLNIETYYKLTGQTHEDLHKQMESEATKRVKYRYLIEAIAEAEKVEFSDKEVQKEAESMAKEYGISVDELTESYGSIDVVKYDMVVRKVMDIIKENTKKDEK